MASGGSRAQAHDVATTVLIVDDELGLADTTAELLVAAGYQVVIAINGKLGLERLAAVHVDIVLVDVMMPVMDGLEMIRHMKADPRYAAIPVVVTTAVPELMPDGGHEDARLTKPFSLSELLHTMAQLLRRP